jgi:hypothetical protein
MSSGRVKVTRGHVRTTRVALLTRAKLLWHSLGLPGLHMQAVTSVQIRRPANNTVSTDHESFHTTYNSPG